MSTAIVTRKLIGGPFDGEAVQVYSYFPVYYKPLRLTKEQADLLNIDSATSWKWPEAVYKRNGDDFEYSHTVHYKPEDVKGITP